MYAIKAVALRTGLTTHTIRVWERRYEVISPERTETNRRLYSEADIQKLLLLKKAIDAGHSIGLLSQMSDSEIKAVVKESNPPETRAAIPVDIEDSSPESFVREALEAAKQFEDGRLESILNRANVHFSQPTLIEDVIVPFLRQLGHKWSEGEYRVAQEHAATSVVRTFLGRLLSISRGAVNGPVIVSATLSGLMHEFGAMMAALTVAAQGWRAFYIGPNLPVEEMVYSFEQLNAEAIVVSIVFPPNDSVVEDQLLRLRELLPQNTSIIVGGAAAESYHTTLDHISAIISHDLKSLPHILSKVREGELTSREE